MRRGRWAGLWKETGKGTRVWSLCVATWSEQNSLGERLTSLGADGSGSESPQPGVMGTAWNSGRVRDGLVPRAPSPRHGRKPLRWSPGTPLPGIHALWVTRLLIPSR